MLPKEKLLRKENVLQNRKMLQKTEMLLREKKLLPKMVKDINWKGGRRELHVCSNSIEVLVWCGHFQCYFVLTL